MVELGKITLLMAFIVTVYAIMALLLGIKRQEPSLLKSGKGGVRAIGFLTSVASLSLLYLLLTGDFSVQYVYQYTNRDLPFFYKFAAFWAGNDGSLLLWAWLLGVFGIIVASNRKQGTTKLTPYALVIMLINSFFFLFLLNFIANPFRQLDGIPLDGAGLNPMLQNPGMIIHPITIFAGYVGFVVPFAFAMAGLIIRQDDDQWIRLTRRWSVIAWLFLTLGNLWGAQWAYMELGWGGYWAWDPVENASFIPWLTSTAFIHSIMIQERKNMLKGWNLGLIIATYLLTLFGTYLVRSGVLVSVHAFGTSDLGNLFLFFIALMLIFSWFLMGSRMKYFREAQEFESFLSRESSFLVNNLLLVGSAFAIFWGTIFPLVSEAIRGVTIAVSVPYFNRVNGPILLAMLFVMGICPLIAWQKSSWQGLKKNFLGPSLGALLGSGMIFLFVRPIKVYPVISFTICIFVLLTICQEFYRGIKVRRQLTGDGLGRSLVRLTIRNPRRWGGYIVHLGVVIIAIGIIASQGYKMETTQTLTIGDELAIGDYVLRYDGLSQKEEGSNMVIFAHLPLSYQGRDAGYVQPEKFFYPNWEQPSTEVALRSNFKEDLYVILSTWEDGGREATFKVDLNPMVNWIWFGGYILIFGTVFAIWPWRSRIPLPKYYQEAA